MSRIEVKRVKDNIGMAAKGVGEEIKEVVRNEGDCADALDYAGLLGELALAPVAAPFKVARAIKRAIRGGRTGQ